MLSNDAAGNAAKANHEPGFRKERIRVRDVIVRCKAESFRQERFHSERIR